MPLVTKYEILNDFANRLIEIGRKDLHDLLEGERIVDGIIKVADAVGFSEHPADGGSMKDYLNRLMEWIER